MGTATGQAKMTAAKAIGLAQLEDYERRIAKRVAARKREQRPAEAEAAAAIPVPPLDAGLTDAEREVALLRTHERRVARRRRLVDARVPATPSPPPSCRGRRRAPAPIVATPRVARARGAGRPGARHVARSTSSADSGGDDPPPSSPPASGRHLRRAELRHIGQILREMGFGPEGRP